MDDGRTKPAKAGKRARTKGGKTPKGAPSLRVVAGTEALPADVPVDRPAVLAAGHSRNARGLTPKQEGFAQRVAAGDTLAASYRAAYDAANMSPGAIYNEANRLMDNPAIARRINELVRAKEANALHDASRTRRAVLEKLQATMLDPAVPAAVQVRAAELLGKTVAMFTDRVETQENGAEQAPDALADALEARLSALLKAG